jgi:hypothetical protein
MSEISAPQIADQGGESRQVIETYRSIAKWVVSAFGAIGAAAVVGLQLTSLGTLKGHELTEAALCVAAIFFAIAAIVTAAVRVLSPLRLSYRDLLANDKRFKPLKRLLAKDAGPLEGRASTAEGIVTLWEDAKVARATAATTDAGHSTEQTRRALEAAQQTTADRYAHMLRLVWMGRALWTRRLFRQAVAVTGAALGLAFAAATYYAVLTNPPSKPSPAPVAKVHVTIEHPKSCADFFLALEHLARSSPGIATHWPAKPGPQARACGLGEPRKLTDFLRFLSAR